MKVMQFSLRGMCEWKRRTGSTLPRLLISGSIKRANDSMKPSLAFLALSLTAFSQAPENSPFYLPIRNNDLSTLSKLIRNPRPNAPDAHGNSPLMYAAALGSSESMRLLLDAGGDPNTANVFAATPLMWCAGDAVKIRLLLSKMG